MEGRLKPREQGDIGELSAMEWLAAQGAHIYVPLGHSPDVDFVAEVDGRLLRIEVKTSTCPIRDHWSVLISTRGGNQSWNRVVKYFDPDRCDYLFVHVGDGRRWLIPTAALECRSSLTLGGCKYSEYEVDAGAPLISRLALESDPEQGEYPSGQRTAAVNRQAQPSQVRILSPPSEALDRPKFERRDGRLGQAVIWGKRRITVPLRPFEDAGLALGDRLRAYAEGPGRLVFERIDRAG